MKSILQQHKTVFILYVSLVVCLLLIKLNFQKEAIFLWINSHHNPFLDFLFTVFTYIGDGVFFLLVIFLFLFIKFRDAILGMIIYLISSEIAQILKRVFFYDVPRPKKYFENIQDLHFVDGMKIHSMMSFPSGHTTAAFALFVFLSFVINKNWVSIFLLAMAVLAGYSRIYLGQHFFEDVFAGSIIGVFSAFIVIYFFERSEWTKGDWAYRKINLKK